MKNAGSYKGKLVVKESNDRGELLANFVETHELNLATSKKRNRLHNFRKKNAVKTVTVNKVHVGSDNRIIGCEAMFNSRAKRSKYLSRRKSVQRRYVKTKMIFSWGKKKIGFQALSLHASTFLL